MGRPKSFGDFLDKKKREGLKHLSLLKQLLERSGMKVESFLESGEQGDDDPYVYCWSPSGGSSFGGIRIYKLGNQIAFRVQKENKTHPYGSAYPLDIEEMFNDFVGEEQVDEKKAGEMVIEHVAKEIRKFFEKSINAEKDERSELIDREKEAAGSVLVRSTGTDYSSLVYSKA